MSWTMRGTFTDLDSGHYIGFAWSWDHEPDTQRRTVVVELRTEDGGTRLTLSHGCYGAGDDEERKGHLEGWQYFIPRLAATLPAEA